MDIVVMERGKKMPLMTNAEAFRYNFGIYATELWAMTEAQFLKWLNADCDRERPVDMVVRCKDCESWGLNAIKKDEKGEVMYGDCLHFCCSTPKWFYCAWGEREEDAE